MKKIILILTIILSFQVIAQKKNIIPVSNVPNGIVKKFKVDYPKANSIIWHKTEKGNYKAKFKRPNSKVTVTYKADGTWKSTKIIKSKEAIPSKVRAEVKQHFPAYKLNKFIIIKKNGKPNKFLVKISNANKDKKTLVFNKEHTFVKIKEKKKPKQ